MTKEELRRRAMWASTSAIAELFATGRIDPVFYFSKEPDGGAMRHLVLKHLADLLDTANDKDILSFYMRWMIDRNGYDCAISVNDSYMTVSNKSMSELSREKQDDLIKDPKKMVALGYASRSEAITVLAQTPHMSFTFSTPYERDPKDHQQIKRFSPPHELFLGPDDGEVRGRMAMFTSSEPERYNFFKEKIATVFDALGPDHMSKLDLSLGAPVVTVGH